eukprot:TRINITY_DN17283_c0_g1_i3.p1 TRINITY_DN17283_c0_g1~~TRINITY_DN17283_c0_g1_i3.p1  ORF type:complete len:139 (-),score=30.98 TRINITY_DN17283_c0_g1_i3:102-518(-)
MFYLQFGRMSTANYILFFFFLMIRRPPRSTQGVSSAASDVYKRQYQRRVHGIIYTIISQGMYQSAFYGLLLTAVMDTSFIAIQQQHCAKNWDRFMELMKDPFKNKQGQFYLSIHIQNCLLYTSPSPRDLSTSRMPSSA